MAWTTAAEIRDLTDIDSGVEDGLLIGLIADAEAHIGTQTDRQFTAAAATRYFDPTDPEVVNGPYLYLDEDLVSVTTLTNGDANVLTAATEYILQPVNTGPPYHEVKLITSGGIMWTFNNDPEIAISLLGSWGYQATVPADIKYACQLLTIFYYKSRQALPDQDRVIMADGMIIAPAMVPKMVDELINPYRKLF
jgi:hypothetical protein